METKHDDESDSTGVPGYISLGEVALTTYWNDGRSTELAYAVTCFRSALSRAGTGTSDEKVRAQLGLADALRLQVDEGMGGDEHRIEALSLAQSAVDVASNYCLPLYPDAMTILGKVLFDRNPRQQETDRLQRAVDTFKHLVDLTSHSQPEVTVKSLALYAQSLNAQWAATGDSKLMVLANSAVDSAMGICRRHILSAGPDLGFAFMMAREARSIVNGKVEDIIEAIEMGEEIISSCPPRSPRLVRFWCNLGSLYRTKLHLVGDSTGYEGRDLDAFSEARKRVQPGHPLWHVCHGNYSAGLYERFVAESNLEDLKEAITTTKNVLSQISGTPYFEQSGYAYVLNLCELLTVSYAQFGNIDALDEAVVSLQVDSIDRIPVSFRQWMLHELGIIYQARYIAHGRLADLEVAISSQERVRHDSTGPYVRFTELSLTLAESLLARFDQGRQHDDIEEAISVLRAAIDHPNQGSKGSVHSLLGHALLLKATISRNIKDVEESIRCQHLALSLIPEAHSQRPLSYHRLGVAEHRAFLILPRSSAIYDSITAYSLALSIMPPDHPSRAAYLLDLAISQLAVAGSNHDEDELTTTTSLKTLGEAASHTQSWPADRYAAATMWARTAHGAGRLETALEAYRLAISLLPQVAWLGLEDELRVQRLSRQPPDVSQDAAACAIELGFPKLAVEIIEASRSILWNTSQELRAELGKLREVAPDLALELSQTNAALAFRPSTAEPDEDPRSRESERRRIHRLATRRTELVQLVRSISGFEHFLLPPSYDVLRQVSQYGPVVILISSTYRCDALILGTDREVTLIPLPNAAHHHVMAQAHLLQYVLRQATDQKGRVFLDRVLLSMLRSMWAEIGKPIWLSVESELSGRHSPRLWWCPTGAMTSLPIHACGPYNGGEPNMSDLLVSSYAPTLSTLLRAQRAKSDLSQAVAVVAPPRVLAIFQPEFQNRPGLPCALDEARVLFSLLPSLCTFRIGPEGTVAQVKEMLHAHNWLHISSHGSQNSSQPLESCIALYDGDLKLSDLAQERIPNAEFAFLSACHSARVAQSLPDEAMHLAAGMMFAGYNSVVATSWGIADKDAPVVADVFYRYLMRDGKTPVVTDTAEALHVAVKHLRDSRVPLHRWVPFIHLGA